MSKKDFFRGEIVKEWVMLNQKRIDFKSHDKVIVKSCIGHYHGGWKRIFSMSHDLEVQNKVSKDEVLATVEEESKEEVEGLRRCVEVHRVNVKTESSE